MTRDDIVSGFFHPGQRQATTCATIKKPLDKEIGEKEN